MREDLVKRERKRVKKESIDHPRRTSKEEVRRPLGNPLSTLPPSPTPRAGQLSLGACGSDSTEEVEREKMEDDGGEAELAEGPGRNREEEEDRSGFSEIQNPPHNPVRGRVSRVKDQKGELTVD